MTPTGWVRAASTGARLVAGAVVAAVAVGAVALAAVVPVPEVSREPVVLSALPTPRTTEVVCAGPVLAAGRNAAVAGELAVAAAVEPVSGALRAGTSIDPEQRALRSADLPGEEDVPVYAAAPEGGVRADAAGAQSVAVVAPDLTGFAAADCAVPQFESWLAGGATTTGAADLIVIGNPAESNATVDLTVFGTQGEIVPAGGRGITIPAGRQRVLSLAGLAPGENSPLVRVTASGAPVTSFLQVSRTVLLTPVGVDQVGAAAVPSPEQTIPGVVVPEDVVAEEPALSVRVLAPSVAATVSVEVVDEQGRAVAGSGETALEAGRPAEITLSGLAAGTYGLRVEASGPVVAAARAETASPARDIGWFVSTPALPEAALLAVAPGPNASVRVMAGADQAAEVVLTPLEGGEPLRVSVPAGAAAGLSVPQAGPYLLETTAPVHASVVYRGDGALAGYAVHPAADTAQAVRVAP